MRIRKAVIVKSAARQPWHAVLKAPNGEPIATTENRTSKSGLIKMLRRNFPDFSIITALLLAILAAVAVGCASFQTNSYRTVGVITTSVEAARQAFVAYENTGAVTQKQHDQVQAVYVKYQLAMKVAADAFVAYNLTKNQDALTVALNAAAASSADVIALVEAFLPPERAAVLKATIPKGK